MRFSGAAFLNEGSTGLCGGGERASLSGDADLYGWSPDDDDSAMSGGVSHAGSHEASDEDGGRAHDDGVGWADADEHVGDAGGGEEFDEDSGFARRDDGAAYVRDDSRDHGADVHVG